MKIGSLIVDERITLREALVRLNEIGGEALLVVNGQGRLIRTVTDGDVRRALVAGMTLESMLDGLPSQPPVTLPTGAGANEALSLMTELCIDQVPLVDDEGRPHSILLRRELDSQILLSTPHLGEQERAFVEEAFRTNWIAPLGPHVDAFEREIAEYAGVAHAAAVSSGTAALHLALRLLNVGKGDVVFCSTLTFIGSCSPIDYVGATPVFIDSEAETWNMSPAALRRALQAAEASGKLPKAVIVVNLYGQSADLDPILAMCDEYGVPLLEDAAESLGATYRGRASGSLGRIGVYSFNGNKIITTSGGGMLISNDQRLMDRARFLATQARERAPYYEHREIGYNYRMSNILAAVGRGQLRVLEDRIIARRAVFDRYQRSLQHIEAIRWMPEAAFGRTTRWLSVCTIDPSSGQDPTSLIAALAQRGIEARRVWKPMHLQPVFAGCGYFPHAPGESVSDRLFAEGVCLPSGSNMTADQQTRILDAMEASFLAHQESGR